ncbi:MAG: hypothetical protein GY861_26890, partial [bacterium]|nr:hypothetical protein [bacterium]
NQFKEGPGGGVLCGISIKVKDDWVTKWDGAENTNIEAIKGGLSDAMKRAGYQWSIGRYLYNLDAGFANVGDRGKYSAKTKNGQWFKWSPPALPKWALPEGEEPVKEEKIEEPKKEKKDEKAEAQKNARAFFKTFLENPKLTDDVKTYFENLKEGERFKISADNKWEIASIDAEITGFLLQETA